MKLFASVMLLFLVAVQAEGGTSVKLQNPAKGVLCDRYFCADKGGISVELTRKYLGKKMAARLSAQGDFDKGAFTFANGVFCDVNERLCRVDRYFDKDGRRSAVSEEQTRLLFHADDSGQ